MPWEGLDMKVLLHNFQRAKSQLHILGFSNLENPCLTKLPTPKANVLDRASRDAHAHLMWLDPWLVFLGS